MRGTLADRLDSWQRHNWRAIAGAAVLSLIFILTMHTYRAMVFSIERVLLAWGVVFALLVYAPRGLTRRRLVPFSLFGAFLAFTIIATRTVVTPDGEPFPWRASSLAPFLVFALVFSLCGCGLSVLMDRVDLRVSAGGGTGPRRLWLWLFLALAACWLPLLLTFGPVRMSADSTDVINQALGVVPLSDSHPILYTGLVAACLHLGRALGSVLLGAYLLGFGQLLFVAGAVSYALAWMRRRGCPAVLCLLAFLYFALAPTFGINAITLWKDIPFNACLLLLVLQLCQVAESRGEWLFARKNAAAFVGLCAALCFLRGNGYPIVLLYCAAVALAFRRHWKRWLCLLLPLLVLVPIIRGPVYGAFGVTRLGREEAAAIPIQQVGMALQQGARLTPQQAEVIETFMPVESYRQAYRNSASDFVKGHPDFNRQAFNDNFGRFLGVWLQLWPQNAESYLNAWLLETLGYWKYDYHNETVDVWDTFDGHAGIEYKDILYKLTGLNFHEWFYQRTIFLPLALMAFIVIFAALYLVAAGRGRMALCLLPLLAVWLGLMAGAPTKSEFRYMLAFAYSLPAVLFITLSPPRPAPGPARVKPTPPAAEESMPPRPAAQ